LLDLCIKFQWVANNIEGCSNLFIAKFVKLSYVWSPLQLHHKIGEKKHWIITYHGFFFKNCEVGGLVIMHREKSRIWKKSPYILATWKNLWSKYDNFNFFYPWKRVNFRELFSKTPLYSHKPFVLLSNGEILSKKRLESPRFLNMIKIKDTNFALNFF